MRRWTILLLSCLLFASLLPSSVLISSTLGSMIVGLTYLLFIGYILITPSGLSGPRLVLDRHPRFIEISIVVLVSLHLSKIFLHQYQTFSNALSGAVILAVFLANIYVIPRFVPQIDFHHVLSRLAAILVLLPIIVLPLTVVTPDSVAALWWWNNWTVPLTDQTVPYLSSLSTNPNGLGQVLFVGVVASFGRYRATGSRLDLGLAGFIIVGLIATAHRAGVVAAVSAGLILSIYYVGGIAWTRRFVIVTGFAGILGLSGLFVLYSRGVPVSLSGRLVLMDATLQAIAERPLTGYGFGWSGDFIYEYVDNERYRGVGPHNAYLTATLRLGIVGGLAYLTLIAGSILYHISHDEIDVTIVMMAFGFAFIKLFEGTTALGMSSSSIFLALVTGYLLQNRPAQPVW